MRPFETYKDLNKKELDSKIKTVTRLLDTATKLKTEVDEYLDGYEPVGALKEINEKRKQDETSLIEATSLVEKRIKNNQEIATLNYVHDNLDEAEFYLNSLVCEMVEFQDERERQEEKTRQKRTENKLIRQQKAEEEAKEKTLEEAEKQEQPEPEEPPFKETEDDEFIHISDFTSHGGAHESH